MASERPCLQRDGGKPGMMLTSAATIPTLLEVEVKFLNGYIVTSKLV